MENNFYYFQHRLNQGKIYLFQHGFAGAASNYGSMFNTFDTFKNAINAKVYTGTHLTKDSLPNHPILTDIANNYSTPGTTSLYIRTQFSEPIFSNVATQVNELKQIVDKINNVTNSQYEIVLVGHSKGGLVNLRFAFTYPAIVSKLVSINTPYHGVLPFYQFFWEIGDDTIGSQISSLKATWNGLSVKPKLYVIGTATNGSDDGVVSLSSSRAIEYNPVVTRKSFTSSSGSLEHTGALGNEDIIYSVLYGLWTTSL